MAYKTTSTDNVRLYEKGQKSIERKRKLERENVEQKSKV